MGAILELFLSKFFTVSRYHILIIGPASSGKKTFLSKLGLNDHNSNNEIIVYNTNTLIPADLTLTSFVYTSSFQINQILEDRINEVTGIIYMLDSTNASQLKLTKAELKNLINIPALENSPIIVLCNKQDLPTAKSVREIEMVIKFEPENKKWNIQGMSAASDDGVTEAIEWISRAMTN
ncbi:hypothetical protein SteCoe_359 [Stentor coeruleus]|uniref:Signal recognition particle receptor subunit beta n=1 Tax=Stentor coeruleus TaxID=5963 RepID=A0A1R2D4N6_9CILI|nr:hypothetical protein SteCoe_359 [Stentor coeruleus]